MTNAWVDPCGVSKSLQEKMVFFKCKTESVNCISLNRLLLFSATAAHQLVAHHTAGRVRVLRLRSVKVSCIMDWV